MRTSDEIKRGAGTKAARSRPTIGAVRAPLREDEPHAFHFHDDGLIPNHPTWPLLLYCAARDSRSSSTAPRLSRNCLAGTAGEDRGATACIPSHTTTRKFTRRSELPGAPRRSFSAASAAEASI